jgi:purine-binding chemotaxis protein CheW
MNERYEEEKNRTTNSKRFLEFSLGTESYAVELLKVKEVITPPEMRPIPQAPAYVCGMMNLRGLVLTVVDLRKRLNITPDKDQSQMAVIIFDLQDRLVGAVVDSIHKVLNVDTVNIKPLPGSDTSAHLLGVIQQDEKLSVWIDPQLVLDGTKQNAA